MNAIDWILLGLVVLALLLALRRVRKTRRSGCSCCTEGGCTGKCASCTAADARRERAGGKK